MYWEDVSGEKEKAEAVEEKCHQHQDHGKWYQFDGRRNTEPYQSADDRLSYKSAEEQIYSQTDVTSNGVFVYHS